MSQSFTVPVSAKLRLCQPPPKTVDFAQRLEAAGASWIALHARTVSARRRRHGAADLAEVARLKKYLRIPVISNGNVRIFDDLQANFDFTGADGLMVGETLLGNPWSVICNYRSQRSTCLRLFVNCSLTDPFILNQYILRAWSPGSCWNILRISISLQEVSWDQFVSRQDTYPTHLWI